MKSGINTPLTVALSWRVLSIVQNAETMGVREGKTSVNCGFYALKGTFMDATVARGFMPDGTVMILPTLW